MVDSEVVRRAMREAHGEDAYQRFVVELLGPCQALGRMRWWQERMWEPVRVALSLEAAGLAQLSVMFRQCPVHRLALEPGVVPVVYGTFTPSPREELELASRLFPFACERAYGPCWGGGARQRDVLFCPDCRSRAHQERKVRQAEP